MNIIQNRISQSNKFLYCCISGFLLFSIFFLGSWTILGPINLRNFSALLILLISILNPYLYKSTNQVIKTYYIWVFVYIFVNILSGNIFNSEFIRGLLTYHFLSVIIIFAIPRLVVNNYTFDTVFRWIVFFYIINAIFTILQFYNIPQAWAISSSINPMSDVGNDLLNYINKENDGYLGKSITPGLTGFVVSNGYFLTCFLPYVSKGLFSHKRIICLSSYVLLFLGVYAIYCTQQRMGFYLSLLYVAYIMLTQTNKPAKLGIFVCGLIFFAFNTNISFDIDKMGRLISFEDSIRSQTWDNFELFMSDPVNVFLGMHKGGIGSNSELLLLTMCHNSLLDSIRRGGIFSLVVFLILYFKMFTQCCRNILNKNNYSSTVKLLGLSCCFFLIYSLTHSTGLQSGSVECWFLYMLMLSKIRIEKNDYKYNS